MSDALIPNTLQEALAQGYQPIASLAEVAPNKAAQFQVPFANCQVSGVGSKCFEYTYPNGTTVVGFCDANGICKLYKS